MNNHDLLRMQLDRIQRRSLLIGIAAAVVCAVGALYTPQQFFRSYLLAYLFWTGISLGCFALVMLHHLVGGGWGVLIRRMLESGTRTVPLMALFVLPILLGLPYLYVWTHPGAVAADPLLTHKQIYLNVPFFLARTAAYFVLWILLAYFLNKWSSQQDRSDDPALRRRLNNLSGPGLILYGLTVTLASLDWVMSLEPDWFSTIFSALFMIGQVLSSLAFVIALLMLVASRSSLSEILSSRYMNDLGNLLLTFVVLWAYMAFSQFLIIWSGNLPDEITWYLHRVKGGWEWIAVGLIVFHFAVPFVLLLFRGVKRRIRVLSALAAALLLIRLLDMFWIVEPAFDRTGLRFHWLDWLLPVAMGGIWIAVFVWQLKRRPLLPLHDPLLREVLEQSA
jgi:hypothetical protein